jgi:hypothetical protein
MLTINEVRAMSSPVVSSRSAFKRNSMRFVATFLTADPVRRILHGKVATRATRQRELRHGAVPGA